MQWAANSCRSRNYILACCIATIELDDEATTTYIAIDHDFRSHIMVVASS